MTLRSTTRAEAAVVFPIFDSAPSEMTEPLPDDVRTAF